MSAVVKSTDRKQKGNGQSLERREEECLLNGFTEFWFCSKGGEIDSTIIKYLTLQNWMLKMIKHCDLLMHILP